MQPVPDLQEHADPEPSLLRDAIFLLAVGNRTEGEVSQLFRRAFIRAGFALLEEMVWNNKQIILKQDTTNRASGETEHLLSDAERGFLADTSPKLDDAGKVAEKDSFIPLVPALKFTLRCSVKVYWELLEYETLSSAFPFAELGRAKEVRDRLTHPKGGQGLAVSDDDISDVKLAVSGLHGAFQQVFPLVVTYDDGSKSSDPIPWDEGERLALEHAREALAPLTAPASR